MFDLNSDDSFRFIYLILLLIFIANGVVFKSKIKASKNLTYLFYWFLITLFIVFLYSFRFEVQNIKNRIASELFPSSALRIGQNQISINISSDNHFYINLKINGKKVKFMIDTGASDMVLNQKDARKIGINPRDLVFNRIYQTANGKSYGASVILNEVEINGLIFNQVPASVNSGNMGTSLLGIRFLRNFKKYEFSQNKLILTY